MVLYILEIIDGLYYHIGISLFLSVAMLASQIMKCLLEKLGADHKFVDFKGSNQETIQLHMRLLQLEQ